MDSVKELLIKAQECFSELPDETIVFSESLHVALAEYDRDRAVVFSGMHYAEAIREEGFTVWTGVEAEPETATVEKMAEYLREKNPETVIAIGGGSVLDAAKAAWLMVQTNWSLDKLFGVNRWSSANPGKHLRRIVAVPTTSGTGSEATPYANIVVKSAGVKRLIVENESVPETAVIVPDLTDSMPVLLTRATGCDALAHLIEGFLNVGADSNLPVVNKWAKCGIALAVSALPEALKGDKSSRTTMACASLLGGMTIRFKSTGLPHLCSFSWFGRIAHGDAVAILLPECWRYYLANPAVQERTMELNDIFPGNTPEEVISSYEAFLDKIGMPGGLSAWSGINAPLIEKTAKSGSQNKMKLELAPHPVPLEESYDILKAILKLSL